MKSIKEVVNEMHRKCSLRVLIISHNVFSKNTNMGKTLDAYFSGWDPDALAQVYFHSEIPTDDLCRKYYNFTDVDAVKSIVLRKHSGRILTEKDICSERKDSSNTGALTGVYNYGRNRSPFIYTLRDGIWKLSAWKSKALFHWIDEFDPDMVFLASGDYSFSYRIANEISDYCNKPLVVCCFDDYYLYNKNENVFLGNARQKRFMKTVTRTMDKVSCILTVNDMMSTAYTQLFHKNCPVIYTAAKEMPKQDGQKNGISYIGGLGLKRYDQLIEIARVLDEIDDPRVPKHIDLYTGENKQSILDKIKAVKNIRFHGSVAGNEVAEIIVKNKAVIHTESFDPIVRQRVKYSLSTKIPDSIASGTCMLAYGPKEVASIDYLIRNDAAFVATDSDELKDTILRLFTNDTEYNRIAGNALKLAKKNHDNKQISDYFQNILLQAAGIDCQSI